MIQEAKAKEELNKFHDIFRNKIAMCTICHEAWPISEKNTDKYICTRFVRDKGSRQKFSLEKNMVPPELEGLTQCEEMLIARAFPIMQVYLKLKYGTTSYKGHVVTLPQNIANILRICHS